MDHQRNTSWPCYTQLKTICEEANWLPRELASIQSQSYIIIIELHQRVAKFLQVYWQHTLRLNLCMNKQQLRGALTLGA